VSVDVKLEEFVHDAVNTSWRADAVKTGGAVCFNGFAEINQTVGQPHAL
jgi:hypothetical protein